ncbi:hypothetical protein Slin15195_G016250 [Septoria linicola]|uniref:Uncharacterized protein n=1 Tax=Septoria linicola TaxID=215465 RepID=A0A9Q9ALV2_9PEZI|nr:hypothetical protein Slin14017_G016310 [Septoria linicola]USW48306.1 hypothetical protein Slin15195_G016250 [Septoria linicola]
MKELLHSFYADMLLHNRVPDLFQQGSDELFMDPFYAAKVCERLVKEMRKFCEAVEYGRHPEKWLSMKKPLPPLWEDYVFVLLDGELPSLQYEREKASGACRGVRWGKWWKVWIV